ncbi:C-X-C motif chemokine 11-6-like [Clupea harengus]|uniref:C-X-C motif chemokine 11-6-like n=1 Tax=Clupea harengus TaxID=7950 RepID=A0A6P8FKB7_CLUHA|nr:C-X-C motif chemokine 11-6-like [Clupea harengus]
MKSAALISLLAVMLFVVVRGQRDTQGRCRCQDGGTDVILPKRIQRLEVFRPSPSCPNVEIIVTLKENRGQKCLNPESKFARNYIKSAVKKRSTK